MRRRWPMLICLVALVAGTTGAGGAPYEKSGIADWTKPPPPEAEPTFRVPKARRLRLANGMALLVVENHRLPLVAMTLVVPGAGSAYDPPGKAGLAAFTADLLDEGAGGLSALQIAEALDRLGASLQLGASADAAQVSVTTLTRTLDPTIDLFTKILTQPAFDPKEVARVHEDRLTALKLRRDRPREIASLVLQAVLFGDRSPYGHPTAGHAAEFEKLGLEDAKAFYARAWRPETMTLVVAGDVDAQALQAKLDATVGAWKPAGRVRAGRLSIRPARVESRLVVVDRPGAQQSDVRIGLPGIRRTDPRYYAFEVMRTVLGDGFTSRLMQRLREQLGYTYGISAAMGYRREVGPFVISSGIFTPVTGKALEEIIGIVDKLAKEPVPAEELEKAKQNLIRAFPQRFETNAGIAEAFAELALHGLPDDWYESFAARIGAVTAQDVRRAAKTIVPPGQLVIVIVGDWAKVKETVGTLGLGEPARYNLDGLPIAR